MEWCVEILAPDAFSKQLAQSLPVKVPKNLFYKKLWREFYLVTSSKDFTKEWTIFFTNPPINPLFTNT